MADTGPFPTGVIVGAVAGGLALVVLLFAVWYWVCRRETMSSAKVHRHVRPRHISLPPPSPIHQLLLDPSSPPTPTDEHSFLLQKFSLLPTSPSSPLPNSSPTAIPSPARTSPSIRSASTPPIRKPLYTEYHPLWGA
ncbi:hypothetical protein IAT38_008319 [Cryptococcus sp. DSM 104549]